MLGTCRRLSRLCRKHTNNVVRHDETPVKSTEYSCRATYFMTCRSDICRGFYTFRSCTFSLTTCLQCCEIRHNFLLSSGILYNTYPMKQPDLYNFETIKMTSQAYSKFTENTRLVFSIQNFARLVTSFLWFQNSVDQAVL